MSYAPIYIYIFMYIIVMAAVSRRLYTQSVRLITRPRPSATTATELVYYYYRYHRNDTIPIQVGAFGCRTEPTTVNRVLYIYLYILALTTYIRSAVLQRDSCRRRRRFVTFRFSGMSNLLQLARKRLEFRASSIIPRRPAVGLSSRAFTCRARVFDRRGFNKRSVTIFSQKLKTF